MSEIPNTPPDVAALPPMRRPSRGRVLTLLTLGLVLVAAAGVASGVVLERAVLARHGDRGRGHGGPGGRGPDGRGPDGERGPEHGPMHERFGRDLGLTPVQESKIDSIFARHRPAIDSARAVSEPRIRAIIDQTRREIDSVLTPEQRDRMHARMKREHPPGDSSSPGGMRPRSF
jgi:Spy/CpxP family protein refolding chaperone